MRRLKEKKKKAVGTVKMTIYITYISVCIYMYAVKHVLYLSKSMTYV